MEKFDEFIYFRMDGRRKNYSSKTVDTVKFINEKYANNWSTDQIREALTRSQQQTDEFDPGEKQLLAPVVVRDQTNEFAVLAVHNLILMGKLNELKFWVAEELEEVKGDTKRLSEQLNQRIDNQENRLEERIKATEEAISLWRETALTKNGKKAWWKIW